MYCSVGLNARRKGGRKMLKNTTGMMASQNGGGLSPSWIGDGPVANPTMNEMLNRLAFVYVQKFFGSFIFLCRTVAVTGGALCAVRWSALFNSFILRGRGD